MRVVEDEPDLARLLSVVCHMEGWEIDEVTSDFAALRDPTVWDGIDALICDLRLNEPDVSGVDIVGWVAAHQPHVRRVMWTAFTLSEREKAELEKVADVVLEKPAGWKVIVAAVSGG